MTKQFVFTITTGRSGTAYLAELLRLNTASCEAHHELLGFEAFGVDTPDVSHLTLFNSQGNIKKIQAFWAQKLSRIQQCTKEYYV
ncbi:unnamed protein product, partial [marine sediment metagenome]